MNNASRAIGSANNISVFCNTLFLQHINFRAVKDQLDCAVIQAVHTYNKDTKTIHKQEIIEALLRDLKWLDLETMVSEEQNKIEGIIAKWESRLK